MLSKSLSERIGCGIGRSAEQDARLWLNSENLKNGFDDGSGNVV